MLLVLCLGSQSQSIRYNQYTTNSAIGLNVGPPHIYLNQFTTNVANGVNVGTPHVYRNYYTTNAMPQAEMDYMQMAGLSQGTALTTGNLLTGVISTNFINGIVISANGAGNFTILTNGQSFQSPIMVGGNLYLGTDASVIKMGNSVTYSTIEFSYATSDAIQYLQVGGFFMIPTLPNSPATYDLCVLACVEPSSPYNAEDFTLQVTCNSGVNQQNFEDASTNGTAKANFVTYQPNHWYYFSMYMNISNAFESATVYDATTWKVFNSYSRAMVQTDAYIAYWLFGNNEVGTSSGAYTLFSGLNWQNTPFSYPTYTFITSTTPGTLRNDAQPGGVGMEVNANSAMTITALGRWIVAGNTGTHTVQVMNTSGTVLASVSINTVGKTAGQYAYVNLATPLTISQGTHFFVESIETGGDYWYGRDTAVTPFANFYLLGSAYGTTQDGGTANVEYVPVNFIFQ